MTRGGIYPRGDWYYPTVINFAEGTTSIEVTLTGSEVDDGIPISVFENDVIICILAHKGTGWATFPGGWNLICRQVSGSTRGEAYWKRAGASETGPYTITGLADTAYAMLFTLGNCLQSGNPIDAATARANASGTKGTDGITTTTNNAVVFAACASGRNTIFSYSGWTAANLPLMGYFQDYGTTLGTDCAVGIATQIMPTAGFTGVTDHSMSIPFENVGMCFAILPNSSEPTLTYDVELTGVCTNTTDATAYEIPSLPFTLVEEISTGVNDLWFKYTPTKFEYVKVLHVVNPFLNQWGEELLLGMGTPGSLTYPYTAIQGWPSYNVQQQYVIPLDAGNTYYFNCNNETYYSTTTDRTGVELIFSLAEEPVASVVPPVQGDVWIPDDLAYWPSALIDPNTGIPRTYVDFPAGERADTLDTGYILTEDYENRTLLRLYGPDLNQITTISGLWSGVAPNNLQIYGGYCSKFYVSLKPTVGSSYFELRTIDIAGNVGAKVWNITTAILNGVAVSLDETILYHGSYESGLRPVKRYDLVNEVYLDNLADDVPGYSTAGDRAFVMADGSIVYAYNAVDHSDCFLRRFSDDGTVLSTYGPFADEEIDRICLDFSESYFWVWTFEIAPVGAPNVKNNILRKIKASTGSVDKFFSVPNQFGGRGYPSSSLLGWPEFSTWKPSSESCPMFVIRTGAAQSENILSLAANASITFSLAGTGDGLLNLTANASILFGSELTHGGNGNGGNGDDHPFCPPLGSITPSSPIAVLECVPCEPDPSRVERGVPG